MSSTLLFFLLTGGSSSLVELPLDPSITLQDLQQLYRLLVNCGAPIDEINAVRKHLSAVKGGRLAAAAPAAMKLSLGVTDVPEGRESALASGPTLPDPTTVADACRVIERYGLLPQAARGDPRQVRAPGNNSRNAEGRRSGICPRAFRDAARHARPVPPRASGRGSARLRHDLRQHHRRLADRESRDFLLARTGAAARGATAPRVAVIADGEVSSPVTGDGVGGRNSAFVLNCVEKIAGENITVLSAGTDGKDGSSPAAGAVADGQTLERAQAAGLDPRDFLRRCDSYNFFSPLGDAIETGPTHNNLRDLRILIAE